MRRARWKRKNVRRVGLRQRRPPAAGGGRLAVPRGGQGRKRAALGETSSPGQSGIPSATLPAAAHAFSKNSQRQRKSTLVHASTTPTRSALSATGRQLQESQKSIACPTARQNRSRHRYADPRARGGPLHRSAPSVLFFWTVHGPFSFRARPKRKWGVHPRWTSPPPAGADTPMAAVRRPVRLPECPCGAHSSGISAPRRPHASRMSPQENPLRSSALVSRRFSASSGVRPWSLAVRNRSICQSSPGA